MNVCCQHWSVLSLSLHGRKCWNVSVFTIFSTTGFSLPQCKILAALTLSQPKGFPTDISQLSYVSYSLRETRRFWHPSKGTAVSHSTNCLLWRLRFSIFQKTSNIPFFWLSLSKRDASTLRCFMISVPNSAKFSDSFLNPSFYTQNSGYLDTTLYIFFVQLTATEVPFES